MSTIYEGRSSDSPYIQMLWRGRVPKDYFPVCPADARWNLLFMRYHDRVKVSVEGPTTQHVPKSQFEGAEFLVIKFELGAYMPALSVKNLLNADAILPDATGNAFWMHNSVWQYPTFDNAETFVERLVRNDLLVQDPVVKAVLQDHESDYSFRTVRRRFVDVTGLPHKVIQQIERAQHASSLLEKGVPILDVVYQTGYADQPHLTRSLRRFIGQTPAQIARVSSPA